MTPTTKTIPAKPPMTREQAAHVLILAALTLDREWRDRSAVPHDYNRVIGRKAASNFKAAVRRYEMAKDLPAPPSPSQSDEDVPGQMYFHEI